MSLREVNQTNSLRWLMFIRASNCPTNAGPHPAPASTPPSSHRSMLASPPFMVAITKSSLRIAWPEGLYYCPNLNLGPIMRLSISQLSSSCFEGASSLSCPHSQIDSLKMMTPTGQPWASPSPCGT